MFGTVLFFVFYFLVQGKKKTKDLKFVTFIYVVISSIFFFLNNSHENFLGTFRIWRMIFFLFYIYGGIYSLNLW